MQASSSDHDEVLRLASLRSLNVLDTDPEERFDRLTRLACLALDVPVAAISLLDNARIWFKSIHGLALAEFPRSTAFCQEAIQTNEPLIIPDAASDPHYADTLHTSPAADWRFYASQPLFAPDGHRIGGLCVFDRQARQISDEALRTLRDLARMVETELQLSALIRLRSELASDLDAAKRQVFIDGLTQTWNRAGILEILQREHARARRVKATVGVAMVDLDNFKEVNDNHGHLIGDRVLRTAAERMVEAVRPYDAVGRFGGEEFLIVLVERDPSRVAVIAERMRANIASKPVSLERRAISISVSVGVACSDGQASLQDINQLIQRADEALYRAKRNGRNQVVIAP